MIVQLLNFNAYYNRQYKELPIDDLAPYSVYAQEGVNFNPNDGITTSLVLNIPSEDEPDANYCVVFEENGRVNSKWFILDATRTRLNQYEIVLRRDLLAEYIDDIKNAPMFIEKATLNPDNPLIFNSEDMSFNQIKTKETPLCDATSVPWIVGYFSKEYATEEKQIVVPVETFTQGYVAYDTLDDLPYIDAIRSGEFNGAVHSGLGFQSRFFYGSTLFWTLKSFQDGIYTTTLRNDGPINVGAKSKTDDTFFKNLTDAIFSYYNGSSAMQQALRSEYHLSTQAEQNAFLTTWPTTGKTVRVGNAADGYKYYKITRKTNTQTWTISREIEPGTVLYNEMKSATQNYLNVLTDSNQNFATKYNFTKYFITLEELPTPKQYRVTIPANDTRTRLEDAPYDMFAIPYGDIATFKEGESEIYCRKDLGLKIANTIATAMGGIGNNILFDLQLLPYCPIPSMASTFGIIDMDGLTSLKDYSLVGLDGSAIGGVDQVVFFPQKSDFSFNIDRIMPQGELVPRSIAINIEDTKVEALCDTYRLVSPNYNGQFEFNAAKNGGVAFFNVDCSYKPYNPYIHINPNFNKLYGQDFNDARGLICGGDFSLPTITDQWISYEINNKNYQNSFNRQIENMEINNRYAYEADRIAAIAGTVQGALSGATTGGVVGGMTGGVGMGVGMGIGALAGGLISGWAGQKDIQINQALRNEALDFTVDQFGYQLGNIRALPYSLNRVSSFNINNKIFPILEYYTCTDVEKEALRNKIKYNGMTVMTVGTIAEYLQDEPSYIKGKLIRLEGYDNHTVNEIANELNKGFYI